MRLHLVIPGIPVSGNHARKTMGRMAFSPTKGRMVPISQTYVTDEAREYRARVASIAKAAVAQQGWEIPDYCRVEYHYWNLRGDADNCQKEIADALQRIAYFADSRILAGTNQKRKDKLGPRVEVFIEPVNGKDFGYGKPRTPRV